MVLVRPVMCPHHLVKNVLLLIHLSVHNVELGIICLMEVVRHVQVIVNTVHQVSIATVVLMDIIWIRSWVLLQDFVMLVRQKLFVKLASFPKASVHRV